MLMGVRFKAYPTQNQKLVLSQWMGCARFIWNAKCAEHDYQTRFAKRYLPIGNYPKVDAKYSQYKSKELSPWLFDCPSVILRNSTSNWYQTMQKFLKGQCGRPKRKKKGSSESIYLTRELFSLERGSSGKWKLLIGSKKHNLGELKFKAHRDFEIPASITIRKENGEYFVSFCYEDALDDQNLRTNKDHLDKLKQFKREKLEIMTVGIDRGVKRPLQLGDVCFDFSEIQKKRKIGKEKYLKKMQKRLSKQVKGSKRRNRTKQKIAQTHKKIRNTRKDFCHKSSRTIVDNPEHKVFVLEDLGTARMTKAPKAKKCETTGRYLRNGAKAKAGLNKGILDKGWYQFESYLSDKAKRADKALFKVAPKYTSQECADCGHTHPKNRKSQEIFSCLCCGNTGNADENAAKVIKKRAIDLILDSGTELSKRGVLLDSGCGAQIRRSEDLVSSCARAKKRQKRKEKQLLCC
jgi:putative transposase